MTEHLLPSVVYLAPILIGLRIRRPAQWGMVYFAALLIPLFNIAVVIMALLGRGNRSRL